MARWPGPETRGGVWPGLIDALDALDASCRVPRPAVLSPRIIESAAAQQTARLLGPPRDRVAPAALHDWTDDAAGALPQAEVAWFLPRLCRLMARGEACCGGLGWEGVFYWLSDTGFPDTWPEARARALERVMGALIVEAAVNETGILAVSIRDISDRPPWVALLGRAVRAGFAPAPLLAAIAALPAPCLDRMLAAWTLSALAAGGLRQVDAMVADLFIAPAQGVVLSAWLEGLAPAGRLAAAAEQEGDPLWAEDFERASALWSGLAPGEPPAPGRESAAVLPWRWRRRWRPRRRRLPRG